jgi:hypothetical protein
VQNMDMNKLNEDKKKLSMRRSILVIVTGILLGWGAAFVVVYKLIEAPDNGAQNQAIAVSNEAPSDLDIDKIEPAAGPSSQK